MISPHAALEKTKISATNAVLRRNSGFLQSCARRNHEIIQDLSENKFQTSAEIGEEILQFLHKELKVQVLKFTCLSDKWLPSGCQVAA